MRAKALWTGLRGRPRAIMEATIAEVTIVAAQLADWLAIMEVTIVAAQLVDWLAGLPVGRQALVSEVPRKDEIHNSFNIKLPENLG